MNTGIVKWFNNARGYGFITLPDGGEAFVHYTNIVKEGFKSLPEKAKVTFELFTTDQGKLAARDVVEVGK